MDASCKIQGSIHSICLVHNMCPELWVHINAGEAVFCRNIGEHAKKSLDNITECCIIIITWAGRKTQVQPTTAGKLSRLFCFGSGNGKVKRFR